MITLEGGLDPDRFVREQGVKAYMDALKTAKRHSDYLIERAQKLFPGRSPDAKTKAMNFLLPHIRRMPSALHRDEFANDAAQKLAIDSGILRQEIKQAAAQKLGSVRAPRAQVANETERVLLRALVLAETDPARSAAAIALSEHPEWYEGMNAAPLFDALAHALVPSNPLDAAPDDDSRRMLAEVLATTAEPEARGAGLSKQQPQSLAEQVGHALEQMEERHVEARQAGFSVAIREAERRNDQEEVDRLFTEKLSLNRRLAELRGR